jgi:hypothetical protein
MAIPNKTGLDVLPSGEIRSFMDELSRVTDRETFNSLMKRFDESFLQRYSSSSIPDGGNFPFGSPQIAPQPVPYSSMPYSSLPHSSLPPPQYPGSIPHYAQEPPLYTQDPRAMRQPMDPYQQPRLYQGGPSDYPPRPGYAEDPYKVPMYNRGFEAYEKPAGYLRTEYVNFPQYGNQGYLPPQPVPQSFGSIANRNPIQESIDLRRVKEEMLNQTRPGEVRPVENITLPPNRYEVQKTENQNVYTPPAYKSFYSRNP